MTLLGTSKFNRFSPRGACYIDFSRWEANICLVSNYKLIIMQTRFASSNAIEINEGSQKRICPGSLMEKISSG